MGSPRSRLLIPYLALSVSVHGAVFEILSGAKATAHADSKTTPEMAGETLDVEPRVDVEVPSSPGSSRSETNAREERTDPSAAGTGAARRAASAHRIAASGEPRELFGAVGARFATDLSATFTRAIPQAFSADPAWEEAPWGSTGIADVTLLLDDAGHLSSSSISGRPSRALRSSLERTLALLAERSFTAPRTTTRLRLSARVAEDNLHDGLHGDVFALSGGSFAGSVGAAFFALPPLSGPGRRVDVDVRVLR